MSNQTPLENVLDDGEELSYYALEEISSISDLI